MAATEVVRARVDSNLKKEASAVLSGMGLSVSDAIRMMLVRVAAERALPFAVREPNRETQASMRAAERGEIAHFSNVSALMADLNEEDDEPPAKPTPKKEAPERLAGATKSARKSMGRPASHARR
ncbi:type II toxin-antitoxin system RelB/DinJ family antitoxin [Inquilinus sp. YAF38]|uniref:type II toxin-antitoxin system RelB/DinJ family antitoxin n=1 Tax=Inquilinus sp. YAF38 TaxID=3233084 RepID=UPI003F908B81